MNTTNPYGCSPRYAAIVLDAFRETIGEAKLAEVMKHMTADQSTSGEEGFSFLSLRRACEQAFDRTATDGIFLRAGRAAYCDMLKKYADETGFGSLNFRLLPTQKRIYAGLNALAEIINHECGAEIEITPEKGYWIWKDTRCPECGNERREAPTSHFARGLLQEYLSWISAGRVYELEEKGCTACGNEACEIRINQRPLD